MNNKLYLTVLVLFWFVSLSDAQDLIWHDEFKSSNYIDNYDMGHPENFRHIPDGGPDGNGCIEIKVVKNEHYGGSMRWMLKENIGYEPEQLYAEYRVKYDNSMSPAVANYGGKGPGFSGTYDKAGWGNSPGYGVNGWSARGMVSIKSGYVANGYYVYHTYTNYDAPYVPGTTDYRNERPVEYDVANPGSQPHASTNTWGSGMSWNDQSDMNYDEWYHVKQFVKLNDIGHNNGILKAWVNGELVCDIDDICFRTSADLKVYCYWFNYYNGGSDVANDNATIQIDDFKLYINDGPVIDVTGISVLPEKDTVEVFSRITLNATVLPDTATNKTFNWISGNEEIAIVDNIGEVKGISEGEVYISAISVDGGFKDSCLVTVIPAPVDTTGNLALRKTATASDSDDNIPDGAIDGNPDTRWSARDFPQWLEIDLGAVKGISESRLTCYEDRAYKFIIEAKINKTDTYTTIVDRTNNTKAGTIASPITDTFDTVPARYVRLSVIGANAYSGDWASILEFGLYGNEDIDYVEVDNININPQNIDIQTGETENITVNITPHNANYKNYSLAVNNPSIVSVNPDGTIQALAEGSATITARSFNGGYTSTCSVNVTSPVNGVADQKNNIDKIYPNPFREELRIESTSENYNEISLIDLLGKKVWSSTIPSTKYIVVSPTYQEVPKGTYVLQLQGNQPSFNTIIIRE